MKQESIQGFHLSPQQERLWLLQQADPAAYRIDCAVRIEGRLQANLLTEALEQARGRHEILRTVFHQLAGMSYPIQVITDDRSLLLGEQALSGLEPLKQEAEIDRLIEEERQRPFDYENGPLLKASLIRLTSEKHVLLISIAALNADSATLSNLVSEISETYTAGSVDERLADQTMQYADFAEWQKELLESPEAEVGKEYWRSRNFAGLLSLKLPFENPAPVGRAFQPQSLSTRINPETVEKIDALAESCGVSISDLLLTCWQILVWRLTGDSNIVVAASFDGRKYAELELAMGLFAKYLPINAVVKDGQQFREVLKQTNEAIRNAYKWQEYFTTDDIEEFARHTDEMPFFPICFDFEEQQAKYGGNDVSFSIYKHYACIDRFKIKLAITRRGDSLTIGVHYDRSLFSLADIERLIEQYQALLECALKNPEAVIFELECLGAVERRRLLVEFNDSKKEFSTNRCIHELFEAQVEQTPTAVAVVFGDQQLTYQELNLRANQLAHHLQKQGVGPEALVAIYVERSLEMVVGLLGVLKSGGAYVPLDPALPQERLAYLLNDIQARVILTQKNLQEALPESDTEVVCLDTRLNTLNPQSEKNIIGGAQTENLAYVIYTSGSTGIPKGVAVEHRQLTNYVNAILERLDLPAGANFALVSTFAADLGNTVLFPSLCGGGCLHILSKEQVTAPDELADYFHRREIDCLKIVPSHLAALLSAFHPEQILPRKRLVLGGESSSPQLIKRLQSLAPACRILNHYGPTETTVGVLTYNVDLPIVQDSPSSIPLGRPIANTRVYLLDEQLQPVPTGVVGQVYIGGAAVARGYLKRSDLTAERFIPDPFGKEAGARLYKTGDRARFRSDGEVDFLGRIDNQVKIRGYRIELGEIEAALAAHPSVRECALLASQGQNGDQQLVAYVVTTNEEATSTAQMRSYLQEKLPEYMMPAVFVRLKKMPLMSNGKVDRRSLPAVDEARAASSHSIQAPRTPAEEVLARIWAQVLGLEQVGVYDNFFELGGDSIISIQIIARANQAGLSLTPRQLFQHQTITELAAVAILNKTIESEQGTVCGAVPLTPVQCRFFEQNQPDPNHYNQSMMLEVREAVDPNLLQQVVQSLLTHHDALRLRFVQEPSGWRQFITDVEQNKVFSHRDLSALSAVEQSACMERIAIELQESLNLSEGPLLQVALLDLGQQKPSRLLLVIHHLAVDGVSWRILLDDLQTAYWQLRRGEAINLPPKTTSFKQWAERLTEYAQAQDLEQEAAYWLDESRAVISRLPVDYVGRTNDEMSARSIAVSLNGADTRALLQEVPRAYNTQINDVLLTALAQTFRKWTGQHRLLIELEGHGREEILKGVDLSRTVGWFTAVFPVLLLLPKTDDLGEALKAIKEQVHSIPNKGIGYGLLRFLRQDSETAERLRTLPEAEVSFNYLGQFDQAMSESSPFQRSTEPCGPAHSLRRARRYLITINGGIQGGQLELYWTYSENVHNGATIEYLAHTYIESLRSMIAHCRLSTKSGFTPSDFPKAKLSQGELNKVLAKINQPGRKG